MNLLKTGKISVCEEQKSKGTVAVARSKKAVKYKKAGFEPCLNSLVCFCYTTLSLICSLKCAKLLKPAIFFTRVNVKM